MPRRMNAITLCCDGFIGRIFRYGAKTPRKENRMAQDWRSELVFYFLKFGEEKFAAVDFSAVAKT